MGKEAKRRKKKKIKTANESDELHNADDGMEQEKPKSISKYSVKDLMGKVEECMDSFNFEVAQKFCERALEQEPDNTQVLETAGAICLELGETDKAESNGAAKDAAEEVSSADISSAYCALAELYLTDNCFEEDAAQRCQDCCQKAIEQDPTNPEGYQLNASCLLSQENTEEAKAMLKKSLELWQGKEGEPPQALVPPYESRISTAKLLLELDEHEPAGSVLEGLLEENDGVPQVWYLMGWMYHLIGEDTKAARFSLEKASMLFTATGCDDQPLLEHVNELLASLPECDENDEEDDMHDESGEEEMEEEMDVHEADES